MITSPKVRLTNYSPLFFLFFFALLSLQPMWTFLTLRGKTSIINRHSGNKIFSLSYSFHPPRHPASEDGHALQRISLQEEEEEEKLQLGGRRPH
jgi:hypothetical protein